MLLVWLCALNLFVFILMNETLEEEAEEEKEEELAKEVACDIF